jgi:hypothetical protein
VGAESNVYVYNPAPSLSKEEVIVGMLHREHVFVIVVSCEKGTL